MQTKWQIKYQIWKNNRSQEELKIHREKQKLRMRTWLSNLSPEDLLAYKNKAREHRRLPKSIARDKAYANKRWKEKQAGVTGNKWDALKLIRTQTGLSDEEISPELVLAKQIALVARRLILNSGYYKSKDPQHIKEYHKKYNLENRERRNASERLRKQAIKKSPEETFNRSIYNQLNYLVRKDK